jgi:transcriptional regulator of acetoin/glycerol metabolism
VRELENVIANTCMMAEGEFVDARDLPGELSSPTPAVSFDDDEMLPLSEVERRHALKVLKRLNGNKTQAAKILGINRATLHRLLEQAEASVEAAGK